ncbi:MAG: hypothetical protein ACKVXR_01625 [Planctomycetota bacterium]
MSDTKRAWVLGLAAFLLLAPGAFFDLPPGKLVVGATRILEGEVPYRDFWTMYAPGSLYLTAGLFALFGPELFVQGLASCALTAAASSVLYLLLRDAAVEGRIAWACALVLALARWHTGIELSSYEPAFLLAALAWRDALSGRLARAGVFLGAAALFKHDFAAYAAVGAALAVVVRRGNPLPMLASSVVLVVPAILWLAWRAGPEAWRDLVVFPATDFRLVRGEPYPHFVPPTGPLVAWVSPPTGIVQTRDAVLAVSRYLGCFMPQVFVLVGLAVALRLRRNTPQALVLALVLLPLFWMAAHVQQNTHISTMAALSAIVFATAWSARALSRWALGVAGAIHAVGLLLAPALAISYMAREIPATRVLDVPGAALVLVPNETHAEMNPIAAFVRGRVPADEPIYVGLARHDATVISSPIVYYLCDRRPAVRYHELHPAITDREDVQGEMRASIEERGVRCVVLWRFGWPRNRLDAIRDRNRRAVPGAGCEELDRWITGRFERVESHGEFDVCWARD